MNNLDKIQKYTRKEMKKYCKSTELSDLHALKLYIDDLYYNTNSPGMSDDLYDILKDMLIKRDPDYVPPVGAKIRHHENRVKLPYWMGSATKITPGEQKELDRWLDKNPCDVLVISEKLDGVSGTFTQVNGKKKLFTRGDGEVGADISYLIQYINTIPDFKDDISVRGELIIRKDVFAKKYYYDGKTKKEGKDSGKIYRNSRNMVAGIIGAKTIRAGLSDIEFVVYEIVGNYTMPKPSDQMKKLIKLGFTPAMYVEHKVPKLMCNWISIHNRFKEESVYELDGIVVQSDITYDRNPSGNPSYMFAFKVNSEDSIHKTTVIDIEWSVSSWGQIVPVAIIDPIELPGNTIRRVTVSNAGLMRAKGIGPGSIINVTRSKEVIPFIVGVTKRCNEFKWPNMEFEWDENEVHLNVVDASPAIIAKMRVKLFSKFFAKMGIKHVSKATVTKMYDHGFDTLLKIIGASKKDLMTKADFREKSAIRVTENIKNGLHSVKVPELMGACGVFGFGVGRKRVIALMTDIPDLLTTKRKGLKKRVLEIDGFSEIMADKVIDNIDYAVQFIDEIGKYVSFTHDTRVSDTLVGQKFVFSGFRSKELEQQIDDRGGKIVTSVSKKTSGIIVANKNGKETGKIAKAQGIGVKVYTKYEFIEKFISL